VRLFCTIAAHAARLFGRGADAHAGMAAVEFALIGPLLIMAAVCTIDLGMGMHRKMQVQTAAQTGAEYAATHGFDANAIASVTTSATSLTGIAASPAPTRFCGCPTSTGINASSCEATCAGGQMAGTYVRVSAQSTYTPILPYPMLPPSYDFTAQATVRIQ
jgi:Flp pilus assembly protein TadG